MSQTNGDDLMPRPVKCRRVCSLPENNEFGPMNLNNSDFVIAMSIDEYETIRLIDLNEMTQEECATQMNIARTTVQAIYADARKKIADAIVNGKRIFISGGNVSVCKNYGEECKIGSCNCHYHRHCYRDVTDKKETE